MSEETAAVKAELVARRPRSHRVFTKEDMERLHGLYCDRSVSLHRVAAAFNVPASTLMRWLAEMDWPKRRAMGHLPPATGGYTQETSIRGRRLDLDDLCRKTAAQAQAEYRAVRVPRRGLTLEDRERAARLLASLSRTIERLDKALAFRERRAEKERLRQIMQRPLR